MTAQGGDALARADAVLRQHGKTFAWARRFLGERHARRATELYAFCRYLDDVADEGDDPAAAARALQQVRRDLDRGASDDPFVAAVLAQFGERVAGREAAAALVDGVLRDLDEVAFDSDRELMRDLRDRELPMTIPSFVAGMGQNPDALVALVTLLVELWPDEAMGMEEPEAHVHEAVGAADDGGNREGGGAAA